MSQEEAWADTLGGATRSRMGRQTTVYTFGRRSDGRFPQGEIRVKVEGREVGQGGRFLAAWYPDGVESHNCTRACGVAWDERTMVTLAATAIGTAMIMARKNGADDRKIIDLMSRVQHEVYQRMGIGNRAMIDALMDLMEGREGRD